MTVGSTSLTWLRALKVLKGARQDACGVKMNLLLNQFNTVQHQFDLVSICGGNHAPTPSQLDQVPLATLRQPQQHRSFGAPETFATVYTVYTVYCVYGANARHLDIFHSESCFMFHLVSVSCVNSATLSFLWDQPHWPRAVCAAQDFWANCVRLGVLSQRAKRVHSGRLVAKTSSFPAACTLSYLDISCRESWVVSMSNFEEKLICGFHRESTSWLQQRVTLPWSPCMEFSQTITCTTCSLHAAKNDSCVHNPLWFHESEFIWIYQALTSQEMSGMLTVTHTQKRTYIVW